MKKLNNAITYTPKTKAEIDRDREIAMQELRKIAIEIDNSMIEWNK